MASCHPGIRDTSHSKGGDVKMFALKEMWYQLFLLIYQVLPTTLCHDDSRYSPLIVSWESLSLAVLLNVSRRLSGASQGFSIIYLTPRLPLARGRLNIERWTKVFFIISSLADLSPQSYKHYSFSSQTNTKEFQFLEPSLCWEDQLAISGRDHQPSCPPFTIN